MGDAEREPERSTPTRRDGLCLCECDSTVCPGACPWGVARGAWVCEGEAEARRRGGGHGRRTRRTKSRASIGLRSLSVTQDVERTLCDMFYIVVRDLLQ